jgi:uncharacterized DUF497 family protein
MKPFRWNPPKSEQLRERHGLGFEQIVVAIESGAVLATMPHPNRARYPRQRIMIVRIDDYAFLVPFVQDEDHVFLKTIIPSRKATRDFIDKGSKHET